MECGKAGVTVNAIVPNALTRMVATMPMFTEAAAAAERGDPIPDKLRVGMGMGTAEDVAPLFVFLASDQSAAITGQCIGIGGDKLSLWAHPQEVSAAYPRRRLDGGGHCGGVGQRCRADIANGWDRLRILSVSPGTKAAMSINGAFGRSRDEAKTELGEDHAMKALMRRLLAATALTLAAGSAVAQPAPLRIGMEEDLSTSMSAVYGKGAVEAAKMAVEDFGPDVIGRKIELLTGDGQSKPDVASALVRQWFDTQDVQMVTGLSNSAIGLAVQAMAKDKNRISIITGSGAPEITGAQCSPNGLHWVIDTYAIDHAVPAPLLAEGQKTWFLLAVDIVLGHALVRDILPVLKAGGGTVVGQTLHPLFTTDMSSPILQAQASKAQVVALMNVGGDLVNAAKQASEFGLIAGGQKLAGFWMTVTDVKAIGLETAAGIYFAEAFYWDQDDAARAWSKRFYDRVGAEPNSYQAGIYGAITHYLKAVKAAGTADPATVMAKMRELPVQDFMTPGGGPCTDRWAGDPADPGAAGEIRQREQIALGCGADRQHHPRRQGLPPPGRERLSPGEALSMIPLSAAADQARMPVAVLSGFLGSGKTTLLNRLLKDERMADTAVAINEFGEVPLDQHLIDHGDDKTVVMANGCLCCNLAGDMEDAVMRIFSRRESGAIPRFARLIVEPSGLADPAPIAQAILRQPTLSRVMRLEGIITVVDGVFGLQQLDAHPEARSQAAIADIRVVSKGDLADTAALTDRLRSINSAAPVLDVRDGIVDPALLFSRPFLCPGMEASPVAEWVDRHVHHHAHSADVTSVSLVAEAPLHWPGFDRWLRSWRLGHADALLRVKGLLAVTGRRQPVVIQGVHHVLHPPTELPGWPSADHRSRVVVIVRGAALATEIAASWQAILPELTERISA